MGKFYVDAPFRQTLRVLVALSTEDVTSDSLLGATIHVQKPGARVFEEWSASITARTPTSISVGHPIEVGELSAPGIYKAFIVFTTADGPLGSDPFTFPASKLGGG